MPVMASAAASVSRILRTHSAAARLPVERNFSAAAMESAVRLGIAREVGIAANLDVQLLTRFAANVVGARVADEPSKEMSGIPHYTVVETEGHNLIVTDNHKNALYFYTIDKDAKIGSDLKLRGMVDLKQVGKEVIKPENVKLRD